jgi:hypothetical protein
MTCPQSDQCAADHLALSQKLDALIEAQQKMNEAFPHHDDGTPDFAGHRDYHEELIQAARAKTRFYDELRIDLAKKGVLFVLAVLLGLIVVGVQIKLKAFLGA